MTPLNITKKLISILCLITFSGSITHTQAKQTVKQNKKLKSYSIYEQDTTKPFQSVTYNSVDKKYYWLAAVSSKQTELYISNEINSDRSLVKVFSFNDIKDHILETRVSAGSDGSLFVIGGPHFNHASKIPLKVFRSIDFGQTWHDMSYNLTNKELNLALVDFKALNKNHYIFTGMDTKNYSQIFEVKNKSISYYAYSEYYGLAKIQSALPELVIQSSDNHIEFKGYIPSSSTTGVSFSINHTRFGYKRIVTIDEELGSAITSLQVNTWLDEDPVTVTTFKTEPMEYLGRHRVEFINDNFENMLLYQGNLRFVDGFETLENTILMSKDLGQSWENFITIPKYVIIEKMSFVNNHLVILASSIFPEGVNKIILGKANTQ